MKWKLLSSEYLVNAPWAVLRKDRCEMPNGHIVPEYYVLEYPNWVNIIAVTEDGQFILERQYRHAVGQEVLEISAGVIEEGETPEEGARRDLLEETGYQFDKIELIAALYPNPATGTNTTFTYLATGGRKIQEQALDAQEQIEVTLVSAAEVKQLLLANKFGQALHAAALFYALIKMGYLH